MSYTSWQSSKHLPLIMAVNIPDNVFAYKSPRIVEAVTLPELDEEFTGDAVVSGWGTLSSGGQSPDALQSVTVPILTDAGKLILVQLRINSL